MRTFFFLMYLLGALVTLIVLSTVLSRIMPEKDEQAIPLISLAALLWPVALPIILLVLIIATTTNKFKEKNNEPNR